MPAAVARRQGETALQTFGDAMANHYDLTGKTAVVTGAVFDMSGGRARY